MARLFVSTKDETPRLFKNSVMEFMSRVHWTIPLWVFIPVIGYLLYQSITISGLSVLEHAAAAGLGILAWTLIEYVMHRWVFHYHPSTELGKRIFFIMHGIHHAYPNDSKRLVLPPSVSIPLATGFFFLWRWIVPGSYLYSFFAFFLIGYLCYDMMHYAVHHLKWNHTYWLRIQEHHLRHHFKDPELGFGVSSDLWDRIIGTDFPSKGTSRS